MVLSSSIVNLGHYPEIPGVRPVLGVFLFIQPHFFTFHQPRIYLVLMSLRLRSNSVTIMHHAAAAIFAFCHIRSDANAVSGGPVFLQMWKRGTGSVATDTDAA